MKELTNYCYVWPLNRGCTVYLIKLHGNLSHEAAIDQSMYHGASQDT